MGCGKEVLPSSGPWDITDQQILRTDAHVMDGHFLSLYKLAVFI